MEVGQRPTPQQQTPSDPTSQPDLTSTEKEEEEKGTKGKTK
jgi:hypothetical protein